MQWFHRATKILAVLIGLLVLTGAISPVSMAQGNDKKMTSSELATEVAPVDLGGHIDP